MSEEQGEERNDQARSRATSRSLLVIVLYSIRSLNSSHPSVLAPPHLGWEVGGQADVRRVSPSVLELYLDARFPRTHPDAPVETPALDVGLYCGAHEHHAPGLCVEDLGRLEHDRHDLTVVACYLPAGLGNLGSGELIETSVEGVYLLCEREAFVCLREIGGEGGGLRRA